MPLLWLVNSNFYYLLGVQLLSGLAWGGFSLSTGNYLYDIRPHGSQFAVYAALQSGIGAIMVFIGALAGGALAAFAPQVSVYLPFELAFTTFLIFICSSVLRITVALWFLPRLQEPHVRPRPRILNLMFRVARFTPVSGAVFDWLTVTKKTKTRPKSAELDSSVDR